MAQEEEILVKVEDEMGIFVKEEESLIGVASTSAYDEEASINLADLLVEPRPKFVGLEGFQKELLVCTKKLDDMRVWNQLHKYRYSKDVLNMIIEESKPAFPRILKKKKKRRSFVKFNKFVSKLQIYKEDFLDKNSSLLSNNYTQQQMRKRSSKAKVNNEKQRQHVIQTINLDDYDDDSDDISAHGDTSKITASDEETDIISTVPVNTNITPIILNIAGEPQKSTEHLKTTGYIMLIHTLRSLYDVYFVNNSGIPTGFYRLDEVNLRSISNLMIIKNYFVTCCWFKRDMRLKNISLENCSLPLYTFMRRPHGCETGHCTCCCRRKYNCVSQLTSSKTTQRTVKSLVKNRWHQRLTYRIAHKNQNSLINAALVHKPTIKSHYVKEQKRQYYSNTSLKIQCKNTLTHAYYLGKNGLLNTYIRSNTFCTLQYFKDMMGGWLSSVPIQNICCLTAYKKYCLKLIKRVHPTVVKFLINSLINKPNKCVTCENLEIQNAIGAKGEVVSLYLPKYPRHTKPKSKVTIRDFNIDDIKKNRQPYTSTIVNIVIEKPIDKSSLPKTNTLQNHATKNTKTSKSGNINKNIALNSINLGIEKLQLLIFPGGKVKIMSKTSPDDISTENLKILREIIQHAQMKVTSQDFNPTRLIKVNNLFTEDPPTQKYQQKQSEAKEAFTNMQWTVLSSKEKVQNQHVNASKNIQSDKVMDKIINSNTQPLTKSVVLVKEHESNFIRQDKNVYQLLRNISAEKRKQYLVSHAFLRNADINLWANINMLGNETIAENVVHNIFYNTKESAKRKTLEKATSPPPKQLRKGKQNTISVVPMASLSTTFFPNTSPNVSAETIPPQTTAFLRNLLPTVPTESLQQLQVPNASFSLPDNVTVIPIGQLPQELVTSFYKKYNFLPENTQSLNVQPQPLNPINVTEHIFPKTSLRDSNSGTFVCLPNSVLQSCDVPRIPVVQNTQAENIETDDTDAKDDNCILGV